MPDKFNKETRSRIMSRIRSSKTKPELLIKEALKGSYLRYQPRMLGNPDLASKKHKVAIFVDGDFWHGWNWKRLKPKLKNAYWVNKIRGNMGRDKKITLNLKKEGWTVIRIWEHLLRN